MEKRKLRAKPEIASGACRSALCPSAPEPVTLQPGNASPPPPARSPGPSRAGNSERLGWGGEVHTQGVSLESCPGGQAPGDRLLHYQGLSRPLRPHCRAQGLRCFQVYLLSYIGAV